MTYQKKFFILAGIAVSLSSCASVMTVQPQVDRLASAGRYDQALAVLGSREPVYGDNNQLLFLLEKGMMLHMNGQYRESVAVFEDAKRKAEDLYTESVSRIAASWVTNDYLLPYQGEDYERVMVNVFQALNFAALEDFESALVEVRDVDVRLSAINAQYPPGQKNVYREDAFARLLSGLLYEASGSYRDLNDALISYETSYQVYTRDYRDQYGLEPPRLLLENLCTLARWMDGRSSGFPDTMGPEVACLDVQAKNQRAEVFIIQYHGLAPVKQAETVVLPLPGGYLTRFSFPVYSARVSEDGARWIVARNQGGDVVRAATELVQDISRIARKNLADRKARVLIKGVARPVGRSFVERQLEKSIERKHGQEGSRWVPFLAGLLNLAVEQADLRSWQTLPAEIRISRFLLEPGHYEFFLEQGVLLGTLSLSPGQKKFILFRSLP